MALLISIYILVMQEKHSTEVTARGFKTMEESSRMEEVPVGYRFYPTEEELVSFYLHNKLQGKKPEQSRVIPDIDIYNFEPCHLPRLAGELCRRDTEQWFFFAPRQEREVRGGRPSRTTGSGYWKATGSPGYVYSSDNRVIGMKKTMIFYKGKAPTGRKTKWKMHEYRAIDGVLPDSSSSAVPKLRHEYSLCRVYVISGSFRAFDRRPLEAENRDTHLLGETSAASAQETQVLDHTSSCETSQSGENANISAEAEHSNSWAMVDDLQPTHQWEWESFGLE